MNAIWEKDILRKDAEGWTPLVMPAWMKSIDQDVNFNPITRPEPKHELDDEDDDYHDEDPGGHACDEPSYYFRKADDKHPDDASFQQQITYAQLQFIKQHKYYYYHVHGMTILAKDVVANILCRNSAIWNELREKSLADNDYELYSNTIQQAAYLVCTFYNKNSLYRRGRLHTSYKQMDALHEEVVAKRGTACSLYEVGELIVELMPGNKYYFVNEDHLATMFSHYPRKIPTDVDEGHAPTPSEKQVFSDITEVVREMELFSLTKLEVDERTRLLKIFLKEESQEEIGELLNAAMRKVRPNAADLMDKGDHIFVCISSVLGCIISDMRLMLQANLSTLSGPLFDLYNPSRLNISLEILDIVDVAEIRRMALGSRFISRSHLIWAFYELGYGLPSKIRGTMTIFPNDEDFPPYHIYVAAMKLAEGCGGRSMKLEHFVYVVFFWNGIGFEATPLDEMVEAFNNFIVDLESKELGED